MNCSLRKWFNDLPWMQQGVLLGAIRNCDSFDSDEPTSYKILVRGIRCTCIKAAQSKGSFNARRPTLQQITEAINKYVSSTINNMPVHFVNHLMMAAEVIGYSHPNNKVSEVWLQVYFTMVKHLHLEPESIIKFNNRLKDDPEQVKRENLHDEECYRTNNYGDNAGTINEEDKIGKVKI